MRQADTWWQPMPHFSFAGVPKFYHVSLAWGKTFKARRSFQPREGVQRVGEKHNSTHFQHSSLQCVLISWIRSRMLRTQHSNTGLAWSGNVQNWRSLFPLPVSLSVPSRGVFAVRQCQVLARKLRSLFARWRTVCTTGSNSADTCFYSCLNVLFLMYIVEMWWNEVKWGEFRLAWHGQYFTWENHETRLCKATWTHEAQKALEEEQKRLDEERSWSCLNAA